MTTDFVQALEDAKITIDECRENGSSDIFVINTCDMNGLYDKGDVILNIASSSEDNKKFRITVPDTWVPWELSHFAEKSRWLRDMHFINAVRKGTLTLIDPSIARDLLKHPDGRAEYDACMARTRELELGHAQQAKIVESRLATNENREKVKQAIDANKGQTKTNTKPQAEVVASAQDAPNVRVISILNNKGLDENAKISALRNLQRTLKQSDLKWILNHVSKDHTKLKEWVLSISK